MSLLEFSIIGSDVRHADRYSGGSLHSSLCSVAHVAASSKQLDTQEHTEAKRPCKNCLAVLRAEYNRQFDVLTEVGLDFQKFRRGDI